MVAPLWRERSGVRAQRYTPLRGGRVIQVRNAIMNGLKLIINTYGSTVTILESTHETIKRFTPLSPVSINISWQHPEVDSGRCHDAQLQHCPAYSRQAG